MKCWYSHTGPYYNYTKLCYNIEGPAHTNGTFQCRGGTIHHISYDTIRYDIAVKIYDTIRYDTLFYDTIRYDTIRYFPTIRYDTIRYFPYDTLRYRYFFLRYDTIRYFLTILTIFYDIWKKIKESVTNRDRKLWI